MRKPRTVAELASAFGRLGGQVKSERKAAAARKNGQKGGWPKGKRRRVKVEIEGAAEMYHHINVTTPAHAKRIAEKALREAADRFNRPPKGTPRKPDVEKARRQYVADVISPLMAKLVKGTPRKGKKGKKNASA